MSTFGSKLKAFRISHTLNLRDFAQKLNAAHGYISQLENGKANPGIAFKGKLQKAFPNETEQVEQLFAGVFIDHDVEKTAIEPHAPSQQQEQRTYSQAETVQKKEDNLTVREIMELSMKAGKYEVLKDQLEKLENRHNKLLEGLSSAIGDYAKMYGPIERIVDTAKEEVEARRGETSKQQQGKNNNSDPVMATERPQSHAPR